MNTVITEYAEKAMSIPVPILMNEQLAPLEIDYTMMMLTLVVLTINFHLISGAIIAGLIMTSHNDDCNMIRSCSNSYRSLLWATQAISMTMLHLPTITPVHRHRQL